MKGLVVIAVEAELQGLIVRGWRNWELELVSLDFHQGQVSACCDRPRVLSRERIGKPRRALGHGSTTLEASVLQPGPEAVDPTGIDEVAAHLHEACPESLVPISVVDPIVPVGV